LAGGLARRMGGGDKPMRTIGGRTILERVIARLAPQCDGLILNANGDPARFADFGLPVIADSVADFPGPLAGILAALDWMAARPATARSCRATWSRASTTRWSRKTRNWPWRPPANSRIR
jgi:molybdopterin-guanine dinucleotide biosynthesis protein A